MVYNTQREHLILPEYGRTIQKMVDICVERDDRQERQLCAESIVAIMAEMNPVVRQIPDYEHKLWDQLAILSDYRLDVDFPFDLLRREEIQAKPKPLKYPMQRIRYRHYGHLIEAFMEKLKDMPEGPERSQLLSMMANFMKRSLYNWDRDAMNDDKVMSDVADLTGGCVSVPSGFRFGAVANGHLPGSNASKKKRKR